MPIKKEKHKKWLNEYLDNLKRGNKSEVTILNYRHDLEKYIQWYEQLFSGHLNKAQAHTIGLYKAYLDGEAKAIPIKRPNPIEKLIQKFWPLLRNPFRSRKVPTNPSPVWGFIDQEKKKGTKKKLSVNSKRRHLSSIKNFYEFLKQANEDINNLFPSNPVKSKIHNIKLKDEDVENTTLLTKDDWNALIEAIYRPHERLIVYLLYYGGLRLAELTHLRIENFNRQNDTLKFVRKGGSIHILKLQNAFTIFQLLDVHISTRKYSGEWVFSNRFGNPFTTKTMYNIIMRIFTKASLSDKLTPHSFRKACATNLYRKTKDLLKVRDYLNHTDAKVTQTYIEI